MLGKQLVRVCTFSEPVPYEKALQLQRALRDARVQVCTARQHLCGAVLLYARNKRCLTCLRSTDVFSMVLQPSA